MRKLAALLVSWILCAGAVGAQASETSPPPQREAAQGFDIAQGPLGLLARLQREERHFPVVFNEPIAGWVREEHLPALMAQLESTQPCNGVMLMVSSHLGNGSTVGDEAAFLIRGFRSGAYPPGLNSVPLTDEERAEIWNWWFKRQSTTP